MKLGWLFDLDGTLVHTMPGLVETVNALRVEQGLPARPAPVVLGWLGEGAGVLVRRALERDAVDEAEIEPLRARFFELYLGPPLDDSEPFDGIPELLAELADAPRAIVTNKPRQAARRLVSGLGWDPLFPVVVAPEDAGTRKPDPEHLHVARRALTDDGRRWIMVGDSEVDLQAARAAGALAVAVTWGYRSREALAAVGPDAWAETPADLLEIAERCRRGEL